MSNELPVPILTAGVVAVSIALAVGVAHEVGSVDRPARATARLATRALESRPALASPVLVTSSAHASPRDPTTCCAPVMASILTRAGLDVVVERDQANRYGPHRARPERARSELLIASFHGDRPPTKAQFRLLGTADQLRPDQRARLRRIDRRLDVLVGPDPSLTAIAAAEARSPEARRLYSEKRRIGDAGIALYRRT